MPSSRSARGTSSRRTSSPSSTPRRSSERVPVHIQAQDRDQRAHRPRHPRGRGRHVTPSYVGSCCSNIARDERRRAHSRPTPAPRVRAQTRASPADATPFEDKDAIAVSRLRQGPRVRSVADLAASAARSRSARRRSSGRETGLLGMRRDYGIDRARFRPFARPAASTRRSTREGPDDRCLDDRRPAPAARPLRAPRRPARVFGFEHVAPVVVKPRSARRPGVRADAERGQPPADDAGGARDERRGGHPSPRPGPIARAFLREHGLTAADRPRGPRLAVTPNSHRLGRARRPAAGSREYKR